MGRLRGNIGPGGLGAVACTRRSRRRRPILPQHRQPRPGARALQGDPVGRGPRQPPPADRRRPGGRARRAVPGSPVHPVSPRPRLLPFLLPERVRGGSRRRGDRGRAPRGRDRRELRAGPRRGQQPGKPRDRRPLILRRPVRRGRPRNRVRERIAFPRGDSRRETFSGPRRHVLRLPLGTSRRPGRESHPGGPGTAPLPPRRTRASSRAHDRTRDVSGARPLHARHTFAEDLAQPSAGTVAFSRNALLRRPGDEGDLGTVRHRGGGGARRDRRVRRRARVPGGGGAGPGDRPSGTGGYRPPGVPPGGGGGGGAVGSAAVVGVVERTLSASTAGRRGGEASPAGVAAAGDMGKYRSNISGR